MVVKPSLQPLEQYYNKVYACVFNSDYKYVAASDHYGRVVVFELNYDDDLNTSSVKRVVHPASTAEADQVHIVALATYDDWLYCSTSAGSLHSYRWRELASATVDRKVDTHLDMQLIDGHVCAVATVDEDNLVAAGFGDNAVRLLNVDTGQVVTKFVGHTAAVRALCVGDQSSDMLYSASEDGTVRVWDVRTRESVRRMEPGSTSAKRPKQGKWLGCVAVNDNWLVTGGGPSLSVWNLACQTHAITLPANETEPFYAVHMGKHSLVASAGRQSLMHYDYDGKKIGVTKLNVDHPTCIVSTDMNNDDVLLAVSGYGNTVDILDTPMSMAASLTLP